MELRAPHRHPIVPLRGMGDEHGGGKEGEGQKIPQRSHQPAGNAGQARSWLIARPGSHQ
jgi:hypothetical protein